MIFAQFFHMSVYGIHELIEATGDRSIVIIDGRLNTRAIGDIAAAECKKRGYTAWQIFKGDSFTRAKPISQVWYINNGKNDNTASQAYHGA